MRNTPIVIAATVFFLNCATLHPIAAGTCGNGVVDAQEDCEPYQANCSAACRLQCDANRACPVGWGCGTDDICRQMKGTFDVAKAAVSTNIVTLVAGDFDGDHRVDIVGSPPFGSAGASRVHYFDGDGNLGATTVLDLAIPLAVAHDLDKDGRDDIGFSYRDQRIGAFGVLAGRSDRTFSTLVFPSVTVDGAARYNVITKSALRHLPDNVGSCAVGVGADKKLTDLCGFSVAGGAAYSVPVEFGPSDVIGNPATGVLHDAPLDAQRTCGEIVFATAGAVYIASPCELRATQGIVWSSAPPIKVSAPANETVTGIYVGPAERLDRDNLLIATQRTNKSRAFYLYRPVTDTTGTLDPAMPADYHNGDLAQLPLASTDFDGNGTADFVFPTGIVLNRPVDDAGKETVKEIFPPRDNLTWSDARVGFFNSDLLPDLLVSFDESLDVDVLANAGDARFTSFTVRSDAIVRGITVGDFDGDRIQDVAFVQAPDDLSKQGPSELVYAFGNATGAPDTPRVVGQFKAANAFGAMRETTTGVDSMAVVQALSDNGAPKTAVSVVYGSGARQQVTPLFMADSSALHPYSATTQSSSTRGTEIGPGQFTEPSRFWQPVSFNVGSFTTKGAAEILSIATGIVFAPGNPTPIDLKNAPTAAWLARANPTAVGGLEPFIEVQQLDNISGIDRENTANGGFNVRAVVTTGDLDPPSGSGIDEIVSLSQVAQNTAVVVVVHTAGGGPPKIVPVEGASVTGGDPIQLVDLDGDGARDLVFVTKIAGKRSLNVLRGDGNGGLTGAIVKLTLPGRNGEDPDVIAFAPIATGTRKSGVIRIELGVVTASSLMLARLDGSSFHTTDLTDHLGGAASISAIASGDVNGDGVPDLAIADGGAIRIVLQQPGLK